MKSIISKILVSFVVLFLFGCKKETTLEKAVSATNTVRYAKGFSIQNYEGYSVVTVKNPWPNASKTYTYILKEKKGIIPDSLKQNLIIPIPIQTIVVTSTTHIPSLEMLDEVPSLIGFPHCDYISSDKVRARIDAGKVKELGNNQDLNTEVLLDLQPNIIIGYGIDNKNPTLDNLQKSGLKVMLNGMKKRHWAKPNGLNFLGLYITNKNRQKPFLTRLKKIF
jgi:iron complex transport system substrate-binding protein